MDDILSQGEIDALMSDLTDEAGGEDALEEALDTVDESDDDGGNIDAAPKKKGEKVIKPYNFTRPERFSRDQLRMLEMMHESFARHFGTSLSTMIRTMAEVKVKSVKQGTYQEYVAGLANPTAINVFSFEPLIGNSVLEFNPKIIFPMIDRILGGPGNPMEKMRDLTDIEQVVVSKIAVKALDNLKDSWERIERVSPEIRNKETNPSFVQLTAPTEMCLIIKFDITIKEEKGVMTLCFPYIVLEPVMERVSTSSWFNTEVMDKDPKDTKSLRANMRRTEIPLIVKVGTSKLTAKQLVDLKPGDVLKLNTSVKDDLDVFAENVKKFGGRPGVYHNKKAILITKIVSEEDEDEPNLGGK